MALRDILINFGVNVDQAPIDKAQKSTDGLVKTFEAAVVAAKALAGAFGVQQLYQFISGTVAAADDIGDMAARLGIATDEFQVFKAVAEDAGTSVGGIQSAFRNLSKAAQDGGKDFAALGVSLTGAGGAQKDTTTLFWEAGEAIGAMSDQNDRLAAAQKLFGRSGLDLIPIFTAEKGSLDELKEAAVVYSEEFIASADKIAKRQMILDLRWQKTRALVVEKLLPAFEWLVTKAGKVVEAITEWTKTGEANNSMIAAAIVSFGLLTASLAPLALSALAAAAPFIALFLVLESLVTFMRGGDSVIGRFIETLLGAEGVEEVKAVLDQLVQGFLYFFQLLKGDKTAEEFADSFATVVDGIKIAVNALTEHVKAKLTEISEHAADTFVGQMVGKFVGVNTDDVEARRQERQRAAESGAPTEPPNKILKWIADTTGLTDDVMQARLRAGIDPNTGASLSPSAVSAAGGGTQPAPIEVTNNITVGEATPSQTREVARQVGDATAAAASGRDRQAVGAAFGL
jgi:hypothetical protein